MMTHTEAEAAVQHPSNALMARWRAMKDESVEMMTTAAEVGKESGAVEVEVSYSDDEDEDGYMHVNVQVKDVKMDEGEDMVLVAA